MEVTKGQWEEVWRLPRANEGRCGGCQGPMVGGVEVTKDQWVEVWRLPRTNGGRCGGCQGPMG